MTNTRLALFGAMLLVVAEAALAPGLALAQAAVVPLKLYYSEIRTDNFTTATAEGERDAIAYGYRFVRVEGYVYPAPQPGTVPLKLYYSGVRKDNFTTATAEGERDAIAYGYRFARVEGYVYPEPQPGTVPLKLYYGEARGDNFTTATAEGERDARLASYRFARVEGYVLPSAVGGGVVLGGGGFMPGGVSFAGEWSTNHGPVTIRLHGDQAHGTFLSQGALFTFVGRVSPDGRVLEAEYSGGNGGTLRFVMSDDGRSFAGSYSTGDGSGVWNGRR